MCNNVPQMTLPEFLSALSSQLPHPTRRLNVGTTEDICHTLLLADSCRCRECVQNLAWLFVMFDSDQLKCRLTAYAYARAFATQPPHLQYGHDDLEAILDQVNQTFYEDKRVRDFWDLNMDFLDAFQNMQRWLSNEQQAYYEESIRHAQQQFSDRYPASHAPGCQIGQACAGDSGRLQLLRRG